MSDISDPGSSCFRDWVHHSYEKGVTTFLISLTRVLPVVVVREDKFWHCDVVGKYNTRPLRSLYAICASCPFLRDPGARMLASCSELRLHGEIPRCHHARAQEQ